MSLRAFLDNNYNGIFDDGDEVIPDVGFISENGKFKGNDTSPVVIPNIEAYKNSPVRIDITTLEDPFWMPKVEGYHVVTRPGAMNELDFPVYLTTEIDGTVYLEQGEDTKGIARITMQLVNNEGEVVKETKSEFDGFYIFSGVVPGQYVVKIADESLTEFSEDGLHEELVSIVNNSDIISGIDFVVKN